ncbi:MAG: alpha-amylase family glycosyl hydrolase, partial [Candidatus Limnocylindrales bacterium]
RLATLLQLTLPGAPCIYYGDEIGLSGSMDPACRGAFPDDPAEWKQEPYEWVADLAELRHSNGAFRDAELELLGVQGPAIAYLRRLGADAFAVVANAGDATLEWAVGLPEGLDRAEVIPIRGGAPGVRSAEVTDGSLRVELPARDGMVVRLR